MGSYKRAIRNRAGKAVVLARRKEALGALQAALVVAPPDGEGWIRLHRVRFLGGTRRAAEAAAILERILGTPERHHPEVTTKARHWLPIARRGIVPSGIDMDL